MSEEKTVRRAEKNTKEKVTFLTKVVRFFTFLPTKIGKAFRNMWRELKKVTWPSRKDLLQYTLIVLAFMAFMGTVIGLLDFGASKLIRLLIGA